MVTLHIQIHLMLPLILPAQVTRCELDPPPCFMHHAFTAQLTGIKHLLECVILSAPSLTSMHRHL